MRERNVWKSYMGMGCLVFSFFVSGCEDTRDVLGMTKTAPDEFADCPVEKELVIPPCFDVLPEPHNKGGEEDPFRIPERPRATPYSPPTPGAQALLKKVDPTPVSSSSR